MIDPAERSPFPMIRADRDGRVLWANPAADRLLAAWGTARGALLPRAECDRVSLVAANGTDTQLDLRIADAPWEITLCPDEAGSEVLLVGRDRTREIEVEQRLVIADRAPVLHPDPILTLTPKGEVTWANAASQDLLEHLGAPEGGALPVEWRETVASVAQERRAHSDLLEHPDGVWDLRLVPDLDGRTVFLFAHDTARAASGVSEPARDNFVANMGHELRTPLNAIVGYTELVQDELRSQQMDEFVDDLEKVRTSAARLRAMIDAMVDLAKLQAGRIELRPTPFYIGDLLDDVVVQAAARAERTGNQVTVEVDVHPEDLHADPRRLRQILSELLDNACKFTENGEIAVRVVDVEYRGGPAVAFRISDTGIGLNADQLARLFRPYAQADNSATRKYDGTGLGLAIARMLARKMGGDVTVRSEPGHGSTFTVVLPREATSV